MKKDVYKLEGSMLDVLFNFIADGQPVTKVIGNKALKQWRHYLQAEGEMSLETAFFGADEGDSFVARTAQGAAQRKQFMALLNVERNGATTEELAGLIALPARGHNPSNVSPEHLITNQLQAYSAWKKAVNAGRVLP
ncbi:hypothetical protein N9I66_08545 [Pseudomonadales bacterium]|nr:hypothetical protein [Pseudomonadales bacterium]